MAYHWFWDLLYLLKENHASRTNPVIPQLISVDTFPPGPISTLAQGFLAWPKQSTKVTLQKILRSSQDASAWELWGLLPPHPPQQGVFRAIPGDKYPGHGCLWRGVTSESSCRMWPWLAFPKAEERAVTAPSGAWRGRWQAACRVTRRWEAATSKGTLWTPTPRHKSSSSKPPVSLLGRQPGWLWH